MEGKDVLVGKVADYQRQHQRLFVGDGQTLADIVECLFGFEEELVAEFTIL